MTTDDPMGEWLRHAAQRTADEDADRSDLELAIAIVQWTIEHTSEDETRVRMKTVFKGLQRIVGRMEGEKRCTGGVCSAGVTNLPRPAALGAPPGAGVCAGGVRRRSSTRTVRATGSAEIASRIVPPTTASLDGVMRALSPGAQAYCGAPR